MYKYKKISINFLTFAYIVLTIIELIKFLTASNNIYGVIYLCINLVIIFLLVPVCYNYKKYYSGVRLSKLIIIILLGIFSSYILGSIVLNNLNYIDGSKDYMKSIFVIKNILKGIIYGLLFIFTLLEFKLDKLLIKNINKDKKKSWLIDSFLIL
jgi:hypothetical protein